ncbi:hypothetical protein PYV02_01565 [Leifsonia sp. H3M29-4]|uniref:hypothetical protein n=1 Tax=Salinibacterium metalliresistens TaxID=3031321 RepID=UPI0023DC0609|nr:hypothetical protein [Salinibacterium metalliresistens]MDF1477767.1 hypothetical protein [Salinibacterium metalliresistens]
MEFVGEPASSQEHDPELRAWAEHLAAEAPPLTDEQIDVLVDAFGKPCNRSVP